METLKFIARDESGLSLLRNPFAVPTILNYPKRVAPINLLMARLLSETSYMGVSSLSPRVKIFI